MFQIDPTLEPFIYVLVGTLVYYLLLVLIFGLTSKRGSQIITHYEPPEGITPGLARFIYKNLKFDDKLLSATLVSLAMKGYITLEEEGQNFKVIKTDKSPSTLPKDEKLLYNRLFSKPEKDVHTFDNTDQANLDMYMTSYNKYLIKEFGSKYNNKAKIAFIVIWCLSILLLYPMIMLGDKTFSITGIFLIATTLYALFIKSLLSEAKRFRNPTEGINSYALGLFILSPIVTIVYITTLWLMYSYFGLTGMLYLLIISTIIFLHVAFYTIVEQRNREGIELENHLLGFKKFLSTTEKHRYKHNIHKEMPVEFNHYEEYLPYAIALDVETGWAKRLKLNINISRSIGNLPDHPGWNKQKTRGPL